jgi:hypothetical protein
MERVDPRPTATDSSAVGQLVGLPALRCSRARRTAFGRQARPDATSAFACAARGSIPGSGFSRLGALKGR